MQLCKSPVNKGLLYCCHTSSSAPWVQQLGRMSAWSRHSSLKVKPQNVYKMAIWCTFAQYQWGLAVPSDLATFEQRRFSSSFRGCYGLPGCGGKIIGFNRDMMGVTMWKLLPIIAVIIVCCCRSQQSILWGGVSFVFYDFIFCSCIFFKLQKHYFKHFENSSYKNLSLINIQLKLPLRKNPIFGAI